MLLYPANITDIIVCFSSCLSALVVIPDELLGRAYFQSMGCILAKRRRKTNAWEASIHVYELIAAIDRTPTVIDESSQTVLRYKTPYFRASAKIRFPPVRNAEVWQVGWIQVCTDMRFINTYGDYGYASWEIPALKHKTSESVSDSDGKNYPWYGATTEVATIQGPTPGYSNLYLRMNDNFHPSITWDLPVRNTNNAKLTQVTRDQSFTVWLVAMNRTTNRIVVLKTIHWKMQLEIDVDPTEKLGNRAHLKGAIEQEQPTVLKHGECVIAHEAFHPPNANEAQMLVWYPTNGNTVLVVPPKYKTCINSTKQ
ncbi:protein FAM78B-like [Glandiceps talaboti]